ncbi:metallophosphoesterase family protein [Acetobacter sp.]|jgi:3',5'-cyclic AMP phosphodiesterase CpdA|uniref:metallophosphoesterase family protein n=1 Tax=Acetobacter sp. TaxID=440 RepID=UPI0025C1BB4A|nr:metallophosphoesterase [Acetobacter sp.]MCH4092540.1 metallophosphoesterase [Acetobacter sp.]MCI1299674.1 metallophosphoesterase [Acetobacter sp.]MCI1315446.1 metallophosphoesterase [Acetobacter sp.]
MMSNAGQIQSFAHLSDVHLPPAHALSPKAFVGKRALSVLSWKRRRSRHHTLRTAQAVMDDIVAFAPDAIADTGDLTNFGLPQEFSQAADWLEQMPAPTIVVPGNHDAMTSGARKQALATWSRWTAPRAEDFPFIRRVGNLALIGVCSAVASPPLMAYGHVDIEQAARLRRILDATRDACRIVLIHHPVAPGLVPWRKSLLGWRHVADALKEAGAELVLHGHSHCATIRFISDTSIPLISTPSASLMSDDPDKAAGWNAFRVVPEANYWRIEMTRRRMTETGEFVSSGQITWLRPRVPVQNSPAIPDVFDAPPLPVYQHAVGG